MSSCDQPKPRARLRKTTGRRATKTVGIFALHLGLTWLGRSAGDAATLPARPIACRKASLLEGLSPLFGSTRIYRLPVRGGLRTFAASFRGSERVRLHAELRVSDQYSLDESRTTRLAPRWKKRMEQDASFDGEPGSEAIFQRERVWEYVWSRPWTVLQRGAFILSTMAGIWWAWREDEEKHEGEHVGFDAASLRGPRLETRKGLALRAGLAKMGVFFVKMGQTLAQRPDLVGDEVAEELKGLQERNAPFPDKIAHNIIAEDLAHKGPLTSGVQQTGCDPSLPALFKEFQPKHVASASLGQVYKGTLHNGLEVALKVQRPGVRAVLGPDWAIAVLGCQVYKQASGSLNDYSFIVDTVAQGIRRELDYHHEAGNAEEFAATHTFLPFVSSPGWVPEYTGPEGTARVLCTKWYPSRAPSQLGLEERRHLVEMAVEACVVQLLITGFVHADPHEGNLRYGDDGRIVFLDFGLMDRVDFGIMECFAAGIRHVLNEDWVNLTRVMQEVRFTPTPLLKYTDFSGRAFEECSVEDFAAALEQSVRKEAGGTTRFGSMATALKNMSKNYVMLTPPYVALLCRTFITLEGLLGDDPELAKDFNIYKVALPFAVQRVLSPRTRRGTAALQSVLLKERGEGRPPVPNWESLATLFASTSGEDEEAAEEQEHDRSSSSNTELHLARQRQQQEYGGSWGVWKRLLLTSEGSALRRLLYKLDLFEALQLLLTHRAALPLRHCIRDALANHWSLPAAVSSAAPASSPQIPSQSQTAARPSGSDSQQMDSTLARKGPRSSAASLEWGEWQTEDPYIIPHRSAKTSRRAWRAVFSRQMQYSVWPPWRLPLRLTWGLTQISFSVIWLAFRAWRQAASKKKRLASSSA